MPGTPDTRQAAMRIGIDCRSLCGEKTGIGYYTYHLIKALHRLQEDSSLCLYSSRRFDFPQLGEKVCRKAFKGLPGNVWLQTVLPFLLKKDQISVFHAPLFIVPLISSIPKVVTIHDLSVYIYPEKTTWQNRAILRTLLPASVKAADAVIADSENTKRDIVGHLGARPDKITVIPLAVPDSFYRHYDRAAIKQVKEKYGLPENYLLFVGTIEPRKNLERLIRAFGLVLERRKDLPHRLILAGRLGWLYQDIIRTRNDLALEDRIKLLGYVAEDDLPLVHQGADLFVYPSLYEGFGLPVLEAMASGIPVITSQVSSLPEVAGDSCCLINPLNVEELAAAIERILESSSLQAQMAQAGLARAREFSWRKTAEETFQVYRKAAGAQVT